MSTRSTVAYESLRRPFAELLQRLRGQKVVVLGHVRPDGDCIGSQVALCRILVQQGVDAVCLNGDPVPRVLREIVNDTPFLGRGDIGSCRGRVAIHVDCSGLDRCGKPVQEAFPESAANFDHHLSNAGYAAANFISTTSPATAELLAGLFDDAGLHVDPVTAHALYVGIATDTGQFRYPSTTAATFRTAARLVGMGADPARAGLELYERESAGKIALLQRFLASLQFSSGGRVCIGRIGLRDYAETGTDREDAEGLVDYARSIEGVEIGAILEDRDGVVKGSLRAKDPNLRMDLLAARFNGGGHAAAAGFNCQATMDEFLPRFTKALADCLDARRKP